MNQYINNLFDLSGKIAVVIGGTGELCGEIAKGLAAAGAKTVLVGRKQEKADEKIKTITANGGDAVFEKADVSTKEALKSLLDSIVSKYGNVDVLVNGAGVNSATPILEVAEDELDWIMNVNFKATYVACQIFGEHMLKNGTGSIINLGSASGLTPLSRVFTYSASKAAVHNLSKNLAREWAAQGVRVNTLVPGFFPAEQNKKVLTPDRVDQIMGHTPMKRFGKPEELIGAALLLASDKAGSFLTGQELIVDGGFNSMTI